MHERPAAVQVPLLSVKVTPMTAAGVADLVSSEPSGPTLILNHNLHSSYLHLKHAWFRRFYERSDIAVIDGWPVLALASLKRRVTTEERIGSTDWIHALWSDTRSPGRRVFILGGTEEINAAAVSAWSRARAVDDVAGTSGYFAREDEESVVDAIRSHAPTLLIVGLGMPKQERFLDEHWDDLPDAYIATVGGAVDYIAGAVELSPRWLGSVGLEWAWRFLHDPRRLCTRYFVEPFALAGLILRNTLRGAGTR
ncbi:MULTISPECIES: WecB/TagA/CpsF family glycosyltransferase [unclassified Rathayibacter]|uniref:WecB/TagA/CpsF family glycosyltransferase n=2 Tax=unclassified Rathayibacter TaxID=2609250 RepID=UPI0011B01D7A|nr:MULTISPECIES: WecB/TagA/CpsF family glycosyltransferase [unclassified Rathayibacter]